MQSVVSNISNTTLPGICNSTCINSTEALLRPPMRTIEDDILNGLEYVNIILLPICLFVGVFGNTVTIIIMNTKAFSTMTSKYFLISLSVSDLILLLTQPFNKMFVINLFGRDIRALSTIGCKIHFWSFRNGKMTSSWFVVCLCLERFTAVQFPFKVKRVFCRRNCLVIIAVVYSVIALFNGFWSYSSQINSSGMCNPDVFNMSDPAAIFIYRAMLTAGSSMYSMIPMCILITVTPITFVTLLRRTRERRKMTQNQGREMDLTRITLMLLAVVITYIVLLAPVTALPNVAFYLGINPFGKNPKPFLIYQDIAQILEQLNYTINFFLYVASNRHFRISVATLLHLDKLKRHRTNNTKKFKKSKDVSSVPENNTAINKSDTATSSFISKF